jgi:hypothetical protein
MAEKQVITIELDPPAIQRVERASPIKIPAPSCPRQWRR